MADEVVHLDEAQAAEQLNTLFAEADAAAEKAEKKPTPPRGEGGKFVKADKTEKVEATDPAEGDEEGTGETPEPPDPEKDEGDDGEEKPPVRLVKVKVDGMEVEVDEEELKKGYSRTSDYTKKTQQLAEERRKFEAEERAAVREERQAYAERLERINEALEAITPSQEPDWATDSQTMNPEEFTAKFTAWKANRARMEKVQAEHARVTALQEQDATRARQARLVAEHGKLEAAIPELKDPEKGKVLREDLSAYAKSIGFTDDDLALVEDHRPLVLLHKARLWDESQKRRPKVEEKVDRAIEAMKPSGAKPVPKAREVEGLKSRLTQSGSIEDAAALLNKLGV